MSKYYQFSEKEDQYIKANYLQKSLSQISKDLKISPYVVKRRYNDLNLVVPLEIKQQFSIAALGVTLVEFTADEDLLEQTKAVCNITKQMIDVGRLELDYIKQQTSSK